MLCNNCKEKCEKCNKKIVKMNIPENYFNNEERDKRMEEALEYWMDGFSQFKKK